LSGLIADALDLIRPKAEAKGLAVTLEVDEDLPVAVNSDPTRIRQILINLVGNAVKFTHEGSVKVAVTHDLLEDGSIKLQFYVIDSGIGIPAESRDQLFDDFTQADTSTSRKYEGTGLGLAISKRLCGLLDGDIGVESEIGDGSTFWFTVTVGAAKTDVKATQKPSGLSFVADRSLRILIAEDNPLNQLIMRSLLDSLGHDLTVVETGAAALAAVRSDTFDLVLMDVRMPEMNGPDATRAIRQLERPKCDIPVLAVTADALAEHVSDYLAAGMTACVTKPINRGELLTAINDAFGEDIHVPKELAPHPQDDMPPPSAEREEASTTAPTGEVLDFLAELNDLADNAN
jgi:two-component system, sensor histidine kinase